MFVFLPASTWCQVGQVPATEVPALFFNKKNLFPELYKNKDGTFIKKVAITKYQIFLSPSFVIIWKIIFILRS